MPSLHIVDLITNTEPTLEDVRSQLCTQNQFQSPLYAKWCAEIAEVPRHHRKQWEFVYTLEALQRFNLLRPGIRGLGFGVGTEPLPAVMAKYGCSVVATEINIEKPHADGWMKGATVQDEMHRLNDRGICDPTVFHQNVSYRDVDMNHIPEDLKDFDFVWSCCSLEHVGSMKLASEFIINSMRCLKPGGVAIHTTEYNTNSNTFTIKKGPTVFYRRLDVIAVAQALQQEGHDIHLNLNTGRGEIDRYIDFPPYDTNKHLKLLVRYRMTSVVATSIGLVVVKKS